jgi:hypothetical protein
MEVRTLKEPGCLSLHSALWPLSALSQGTQMCACPRAEGQVVGGCPFLFFVRPYFPGVTSLGDWPLDKCLHSKWEAKLPVMESCADF